MRLIDADSLKLNCRVHLTDEDAKILGNALNEMIQNAPTIEAEPVRHGRWYLGDDFRLHCSNCSKIPTNRLIADGILILDFTPIEATMLFCPNCGARVDE